LAITLSSRVCNARYAQTSETEYSTLLDRHVETRVTLKLSGCMLAKLAAQPRGGLQPNTTRMMTACQAVEPTIEAVAINCVRHTAIGSRGARRFQIWQNKDRLGHKRGENESKKLS